MTQFTPGPWTTYEHSRGIDVIVDDGADGIDVATVRNPADARLIAEAPAMLAALQTLDDNRGHTFHKPAGQKGYEAVIIPRDIFDAAMAAIARATGQTETSTLEIPHD